MARTATSKGRTALVMFAREPEPGQVKTRVAADLGDEVAAGLYRAFVEDLCAALAKRFPLWLACTPDSGSRFFRGLAQRHGLELLSQGEGDLGARMRRVATTLLDHASRVVVIGSDAPTLPIAHVRAAFEGLRRAPVVLGPSLDGGYYLLGLRAPVPRIFDRMPWGGDQVLARTLRRLRTAGRRAEMLPCWYDVDTAADVTLLRRHLALLATLGTHACPRTVRVLRRARVP